MIKYVIFWVVKEIIVSQYDFSNKASIIKKIIIFILVICLIAASGAYYIKYKQSKEEKAYASDLTFAVMAMVDNASRAEKMLSIYSYVWNTAITDDVWYTAVFSDEYEIVDDQCYCNYNEALDVQKLVFEQNGKLNELNEIHERVRKYMEKLGAPPNNYKEAYEITVEIFGAYNEFISLAQNPEGSLQSFNSKIDELNSNINKKWHEWDSKMPCEN